MVRRSGGRGSTRDGRRPLDPIPNSKALLLNLNLIVTRLEKAVAFGAETIEFGFHRHERVAGGFLKHRGLP